MTRYAIGYGWGEITLTSECVNGKKLTVTFAVSAKMFGAGTPSQDDFDLVVDDFAIDNLNPSRLEGGFSYNGAGGNVGGADLSTTSITMGQGVATSVNTRGGMGVGIGITIQGSSKRISNYNWSDCECENK